MKVSPLVIRSSSICMLATLLSIEHAFGQAGNAAGDNPAGAQPAEASAGVFITKEWKLPAEVIPGVKDSKNASADPTEGRVDRVATKEWLSSKGIVVEPPAAAIFLLRSNRLIVRTTRAQLDLIDALVEREVAARPMAPQKNTPVAPGDPARMELKTNKAASDPVISKIELRDASPAQAFKTITDATGTKIFYEQTPERAEAQITISLTNVPMSEALRYITSLANLRYTTDKDGVHIDTK